ncbi:Hypothetical predicted protein [Olea europaea subsp. europaea]|uniref:Transmembrane protein n=1 Tax=Olea europaea subsp. europaea TaxID=158383 RepID=A0A8S0SCV6_OLEEU|nr:Hypothetical predicted protein [Olea europaea subsp. europaea]
MTMQPSHHSLCFRCNRKMRCCLPLPRSTILVVFASQRHNFGMFQRDIHNRKKEPLHENAISEGLLVVVVVALILLVVRLRFWWCLGDGGGVATSFGFEIGFVDGVLNGGDFVVVAVVFCVVVVMCAAPLSVRHEVASLVVGGGSVLWSGGMSDGGGGGVV